MSLPFLKKSHAHAARLLHEAGLTVSQIPQAIHVARDTVETWVNREVAKGHATQALEILKGQVQEKGHKILFEQLRELVLVRLMIHLGVKSVLASSIATLLLPFVMKRMLDVLARNPEVSAWWANLNLRQHLPTTEEIKAKLDAATNALTSKNAKEDIALT
jgi:transposase